MEQRQRRAIVAVTWGRLNGRKKVIAPGEVLRVGRGELADLVVPHDAKMSAVHFEVAWNGERCWVRDLKSAKGTRINGEEGRAEGEIANGGWIQAGETVFTVHFEGATPARPEEEDDDDGEGERSSRVTERLARAEARKARAARAQAALTLLQAEKAPLYAVLDGARDQRVLELLRESVEEHQSLYEGTRGEALAHAAPYLVRFCAESNLLKALVQEGWGRRWGIYLASQQAFHEVRRHLRRFLMVKNEQTGSMLYFRFYDPSVLRTIFPTFSAHQKADLLGEIEAFLVEGRLHELIRHDST